eukprot:11086158-Karenia_brevis.AAC.1
MHHQLVPTFPLAQRISVLKSSVNTGGCSVSIATASHTTPVGTDLPGSNSHGLTDHDLAEIGLRMRASEEWMATAM